MKKLEIFDPALCCPTGVCGPSIDPELARIASALFLLEKKGKSIKRHNLGNEPEAFIANPHVQKRLNEKGPNALPIILWNGEVVKEASYPTNEELASWFEVDRNELMIKKSNSNLL